MAPMKTLTFGFLTSLLSTESNNSRRHQDRPMEETIYDSDDSQTAESGEMNKHIVERREWSRRENLVNESTKKEQDDTNIKLKKSLSKKVNFNY